MDIALNITPWIVIRTAIILAAIYALLKVVAAIIDNTVVNENLRTRMQAWFRGATALYLPLAIVILVVALILWQQRLIGIPALLCLILFYKPLSHFFQGLAVRAKGDLDIGSYIRVGKIAGDVQRFGTTELKVATGQGLASIPYGRLFDQGYTVSEKTRQSAYYEIRAKVTENSRKDIADLLAATPYIKLDSTVKIKDLLHDHISVQVVPRSADYLDDLAALIREARYEAVTIHNN